MSGTSNKKVVCFICGLSLTDRDAVSVRLTSREMRDAEQTLFAHKRCFSEITHSSVPLHPDLETIGPSCDHD
jgi:hypothetical protein